MIGLIEKCMLLLTLCNTHIVRTELVEKAVLVGSALNAHGLIFVLVAPVGRFASDVSVRRACLAERCYPLGRRYG